MKKTIIALTLLLSLFVISGCNNTSGSKEVKTIVIDGGGDIGNFNTTPLMTPSEANPFPYNTLEQLAKEWEALNPGYKIEINKTSSNGDRAILVPQLNNKTAPDITYQNGTVVNMDLGKDYYVVLNDYLDQPNKYVDGNEAWKDLYIPTTSSLISIKTNSQNVTYAAFEAEGAQNIFNFLTAYLDS